jgi:hypothetical protein
VLGASLVDLRREAPPALALEIALLHDLHRRAVAAPLRARPVLPAGKILAEAGRTRHQSSRSGRLVASKLARAIVDSGFADNGRAPDRYSALS